MLLFILLCCFGVAVLIPFTGQFIRHKAAHIMFLLPLGLFLLLLLTGNVNHQESYAWLPQLGIHLSLQLDGLSRLFVLIITGIGSLVFFYSAAYFKGHPYLDRFFAFMSLFMGAMIGLVLSENIVTLFIFWELTSISSFFLIGFNNHDIAARKSALTALTVTGLGGLALLLAGLLLNSAGGSLSLNELRKASEIIATHPFYTPAVVLVFLAAFTKSAQFPFHFWLPGAMKAPTPVSTYLHSATMVKAGIYLLLRMSPILSGTQLWQHTLLWVGGITMLYAALHSIFRSDLKSILAYTTISALGILVFLIGLGTSDALLAAGLFVLIHALYKAALFLITGIVDHQTHSRDIRQLSGLRLVMLPVALAGLLAAWSNAGIPPSFGFIGKDLMYEAALQFPALPNTVWLAGALIITKMALLYSGMLAGVKPFIGPLPENFNGLRLPAPSWWLPPLLLGIFSMLFGLFPAIPGSLSNDLLFALGQPELPPIKLWHGFNKVLMLSAVTIAGGLVLWWQLKPGYKAEMRLAKFEPLSPYSLFGQLGRSITWFATVWTGFFQHGYLRYYVMTIILVLTAAMGYRLFQDYQLELNTQTLVELTFYEGVVVGVMVLSIGFSVFSKSRLAAVAGMGVLGYAICLLFVFYSAPDLAMTQFTIDTLAVILFVLVLYRLPRYKRISNAFTVGRDLVISLAFGAMISLLALLVLQQPQHSEVADFYAANAYLLAKGKNVVNVILVDFRGLDTLVEIGVLSIAAIGVFGLIKLRLKLAEKKG
jgi:multicomponent Na+:H+ antiporter subunit A